MEKIPATLDRLVVPVGEVRPTPGNPRRGDVEAIAESLDRNGQYRPIVVNSRTQKILAGNHTYAAARHLGWERIAVTFVDVDEDQAARIILADNRTADLGGYDDTALAAILATLDGDLEGTGYEPEDVKDVLDRLLDEEEGGGVGEGEDGELGVTGEMLALTDVLFGEPQTLTESGEVWRVGRHLLVVAKLSTEHEVWSPFLSGRIFCPYPEIYLTSSDTAMDESRPPMLMVQPNRYLAGHLLDKHRAVFPDERVELAE